MVLAPLHEFSCFLAVELAILSQLPILQGCKRKQATVEISHAFLTKDYDSLTGGSSLSFEYIAKEYSII